MKRTANMIFFWGKNDFLSQWHPATFHNREGIVFSCAEQYMMWRKAILFQDENSARRILTESDPRRQKQLGRRIAGFDENIWREHRENAVFEGNVLKFLQNKDLLEQLLATGDAMLVEASPYDRVWGVGLSADDPRILNPANWQGENLLGKCLQRSRNWIREYLTPPQQDDNSPAP